ncbi:MAG: hypothetical protein JNM93_05120 [Bacteriovoracaceae bacterium]|nr:hypothetical protein [Bacteriovoracaceae bacterium]
MKKKLSLILLTLSLVTFIGCDEDVEEMVKHQGVLADIKMTFLQDPCEDDNTEVEFFLTGKINISTPEANKVINFTSDPDKKTNLVSLIDCSAFKFSWSQSETHTASSPRTFISETKGSCKFEKTALTEGAGNVLNLTVTTDISKDKIELASNAVGQIDLSKVAFQNGSSTATVSCADVKPKTGGRVSNDSGREINFKLDLSVGGDSSDASSTKGQ